MNEVNLQHADCLRSQSNIGETIVHNICDMSISIVPWGSLDWAGFGFIVSIVLGFVFIIVHMIRY